MRDLNQQAGAIAGFGIAAASATMLQVQKNLNAFEDDIVRPLAPDIDHEANAACVAFTGRIVQALCFRETSR